MIPHKETIDKSEQAVFILKKPLYTAKLSVSDDESNDFQNSPGNKI